METKPPTDAGTGTLAAAREHARRQAGVVASTQATVPAAAAVDLPVGVDPSAVVWDEVLGAGSYAARRVARGTVVALTDSTGDTCVNLQVVNGALPVERLNPADTVKVQWQAYLGEGSLLLSDMGRVLMTMTDDSSGRHDALCGHSNRRHNEERYGHGAVHGAHPNVRDLLALAGARHGLDRRDLTSGINLFAGVRVAEDGALSLLAPTRRAGAVRLRAELDVIVLLAVGPHPLDERPEGTAGPVRITAWTAHRPDPDPFRATAPERERAFENTEHHLLEQAQ
ncbi:MAG: urea carboxylase [Acidimicrobiales bacterium]|nr:urea carboxylase [Acidimicrobiales bacterium]